MNIVIIEGNQTLPHTISLLKAITDSYYTMNSAPDGKPISIFRQFLLNDFFILSINYLNM